MRKADPRTEAVLAKTRDRPRTLAGWTRQR